MNRPPLARLKLPVALVLAALLLVASAVWWTHDQANEARTALQQQLAARDASRLQLERSREQQALITTHLADYQALARRGFVGAENRLAWIEAAQLAQRDVGLPGLEYRLAPRTPSPPALAQGLPLGETAMTLTLPLLVETDLIRFLGALKQHAPGIHRVKGCGLSRLDNTSFEAANQPRLQAECELLWFTVTPTQAASP